jgi:hypothetical protein
MPYDQDKYRQYSAAIQEMQRDVCDRLAEIGYPVIISEPETPLSARPDAQGSPLPRTLTDDPPVIRVNLLDGVVTVEHDLNMTRQHRALEEMGVPHEYAPSRDHTETGPTPSIIRLNLASALQHLPGAFAKAREEVKRRVHGDKGEREI